MNKTPDFKLALVGDKKETDVETVVHNAIAKNYSVETLSQLNANIRIEQNLNISESEDVKLSNTQMEAHCQKILQFVANTTSQLSDALSLKDLKSSVADSESASFFGSIFEGAGKGIRSIGGGIRDAIGGVGDVIGGLLGGLKWVFVLLIIAGCVVLYFKFAGGDKGAEMRFVPMFSPPPSPAANSTQK